MGVFIIMPYKDWDELYSACMSCRGCKLADTRTNVVFGVGNREADLMFVGEAPGHDEDMRGEPFVGRAGKLLDDMLEFIGLDRTKIYIANVVKCRPPQNRDPQPEEENACENFLESQIALIKPKIIVCLGRIAACRLIKPDFKITRERGLWFQKDGILYTTVYHPAFLLRDPRRKGDTLDDLREIEKRLGQLG